MGLMLSVFVFCVGVVEALDCWRHLLLHLVQPQHNPPPLHHPHHHSCRKLSHLDISWPKDLSPSDDLHVIKKRPHGETERKHDYDNEVEHHVMLAVECSSSPLGSPENSPCVVELGVIVESDSSEADDPSLIEIIGADDFSDIPKHSDNNVHFAKPDNSRCDHVHDVPVVGSCTISEEVESISGQLSPNQRNDDLTIACHFDSGENNAVESSTEVDYNRPAAESKSVEATFQQAINNSAQETLFPEIKLHESSPPLAEDSTDSSSINTSDASWMVRSRTSDRPLKIRFSQSPEEVALEFMSVTKTNLQEFEGMKPSTKIDEFENLTELASTSFQNQPTVSREIVDEVDAEIEATKSIGNACPDSQEDTGEHKNARMIDESKKSGQFETTSSSSSLSGISQLPEDSKDTSPCTHLPSDNGYGYEPSGQSDDQVDTSVSVSDYISPTSVESQSEEKGLVAAASLSKATVVTTKYETEKEEFTCPVNMHQLPEEERETYEPSELQGERLPVVESHKEVGDDYLLSQDDSTPEVEAFMKTEDNYESREVQDGKPPEVKSSSDENIPDHHTSQVNNICSSKKDSSPKSPDVQKEEFGEIATMQGESVLFSDAPTKAPDLPTNNDKDVENTPSEENLKPKPLQRRDTKRKSKMKPRNLPKRPSTPGEQTTELCQARESDGEEHADNQAKCNPALREAHGTLDQPALREAHGTLDQPALREAHGTMDQPPLREAHGTLDQPALRGAHGKMDQPASREAHGTLDQQALREAHGTMDNSSKETADPPAPRAPTEEAKGLIFSGEYTKAMNKDWHSGHFCCWQCDESLTGQRYVLRDDHPYCIKCYESVFANSCEECNKTIGIDSKDLSYKDKHWHEACFLCNKCRLSLVDKQFGSKADKIFCGPCYDSQFASRCDGCGQIFKAGTKKMEYKTRQWHEPCFSCCVCKSPIGTKSFIPREQEIYCATCYEEKFATRCVKCNKIITSGGVTYKNEPWHRECFTCTNCNTSLAGQRFTSRDEKPYCADCFGELFAKRCTACCKPITGIGGTRFISFEDRHWHNDCFICASCKTSLVGRGFITDAEDIICPECAKQKLM